MFICFIVYTAGVKDKDTIDKVLDALSIQPFRAKFHLTGRELALVSEKGLDTIRQHAFDILSKRVCSAIPLNDGKQTPYRGHPVFVAQHATATCCRGCIVRWHQIPKGREISDEEKAYLVEVIERWVLRELE